MRKMLMMVIAIAASCYATMAQNPKWDKCRDRDVPGEQIYRHYTGTIGEQQVSLDLVFGFCGGSNYGGSTYYFPGETEKTRIIIGEPDSFDLHIMLRAHEVADENPFKSESNNDNPWDKMPGWTFRVLDDGIKGEWISPDKNIERKINLKEDYSRSVPMDLVWSDNKKGDQLLYTRPSAKAKTRDAAFVTDAELTFLGESHKHSQTLASYLRNFDAKSSGGAGYFIPVYNDNGFLVFHREVENMGSPAVRHKYLNLDVQRQQVLALTDVLQPGKALQALVEALLREKYGLDNDKKLSTWFRFENAPLGEFMLTDGGIAFCYDMDALKERKNGFTFDPIFVVVPYCSIRDILQPGFRRRVGL